jgi:hypothetical protein
MNTRMGTVEEGQKVRTKILPIIFCGYPPGPKRDGCRSRVGGASKGSAGQPTSQTLASDGAGGFKDR